MKTERIVFHIDDDEDDRDFFKEALNGQKGLTIYSFPSFEDAMAHAPAANPDFIFMDFWVPGMTAGQFLRQLSAQIDLSMVGITVLSGTQIPPLFKGLLDIYNVKYAMKPHDSRVLQQLLFENLFENM